MWKCGSITGKGKKFFLPQFAHLSLGLANPLVHTAKQSKQQDREANRSSPSNAEIRNAWSYRYSLVCFRALVLY
jgi:hypothetical protein